MNPSITTLSHVLNSYKNIVFITGAATFNTLGIKETRATKEAQKILTPRFLQESPQAFYNFYKRNFDYRNVKPTNMHKKIAFLEMRNKCIGVITQCVDNLHVQAGSKNVIELYGNIHDNYCSCRNVSHNPKYEASAIFDTKDIPTCSCQALIHPGVVLHNEAVNRLDKAMELIDKSDAIIICGDISASFPTKMLAKCITPYQALIIINKRKTIFDDKASLKIKESPEDAFAKL